MINVISKDHHWLQLQPFLKFPASLSGDLLVYIRKCCRYLCLQANFDVARIFVGLSLNQDTRCLKYAKLGGWILEVM